MLAAGAKLHFSMSAKTKMSYFLSGKLKTRAARRGDSAPPAGAEGYGAALSLGTAGELQGTVTCAGGPRHLSNLKHCFGNVFFSESS